MLFVVWYWYNDISFYFNSFTCRYTERERERCSALCSPQLCQCISSQHSRCCRSDDCDASLRSMLCSAILIILSSFPSFFNVITMGSILGARQLLCIVISTITQHWLSKVLQGIRYRKSVAVCVVSLVEFPFWLGLWSVNLSSE